MRWKLTEHYQSTRLENPAFCLVKRLRKLGEIGCKGNVDAMFPFVSCKPRCMRSASRNCIKNELYIQLCKFSLYLTYTPLHENYI